MRISAFGQLGGFGQGLREALVDLVLHDAQGSRAGESDEIADVGADFCGESVGREDLVDEADAESFSGIDGAGGEKQVEGVGEADEAGEHPGDAVFGDEAAAREGGGEFGGVGGETEIAVERDEAEADDRAVDGGDDGLGECREIGIFLGEIAGRCEFGD